MTPFRLRKRLKHLLKKSLGLESEFEDGDRPAYTPPPRSEPGPVAVAPAPPPPPAQQKPAPVVAEPSPSSPKEAPAKKAPAKKAAPKKAPAKKAAPKKAPAKKAPAKKAPAKKAPAKKAAAKKSSSQPADSAESPAASGGDMWVQAPGVVASEVVPDTAHSVEVFGTRYALYKVGDEFFATLDSCPHAGGPLGGGALDGFIVACPFHGYEYDVRDGSCTSGQPVEVASVPVRVKADRVLLQVAT